jgi:hypothetical protein
MAQPLLNNVINPGNMDRPINQIIPDAEEEGEGTESLFM